MYSNVYHVVSRKFCCCLPVRIGVFILSALGTISGFYGAYAIWYIVARTAKNGTVSEAQSSLNGLSSTTFNGYKGVALDKAQYYAFIVIGIITTMYALCSLAGFIGSILRKRRLVALYSTLLWILLTVNIGVAIYVGYVDIHNRGQIQSDCQQWAANGTVSDNGCDDGSHVSVAVEIISLIISLLFQLYGCIIVKRYVEQLSEEQGFQFVRAGNRVLKTGDASGSYYPHQPLGTQPQQHELGPYPYGQPDNSFGTKV